MQIINISMVTVYLDDIGFELTSGQVFNTDNVNTATFIEDNSVYTAIQAGYVVYLDYDNITQLNKENSLARLEIDKRGFDLSKFLDQAQIQAMIDLAVSNNTSNNSGALSVIDDIVKLPTAVVKYNDLRAGYKDNSGSSNFYKYIPVSYYINRQQTSIQTIADVSGKGYFTGLMLPCLETSRGTNREVTVTITIDGEPSTESFVFSDDFDDKLRLMIGSTVNSDSSSSSHGKDTGPTVALKSPDSLDDSCYSNRRPQPFGLTDDAIVPHPSAFLNDTTLPRIPFYTSLKVQYQMSEVYLFENSTYRNRSVAFYMLGDF